VAAIGRYSLLETAERKLRLTRSRRARRLAWAFLSASALRGLAAHAQPNDAPAASQPATRSAKEHYLRGVEFAKARSWEAALAEFNASLALRGTSAAAMNAAYCLQQLGRNAEALELYLQVLRDLDSALIDQERANVRASIAELGLVVGHLALNCNVADATVLVDGEARGKTPIGDLLLNPGLHVVRVMKQGYEPVQVSLTIAATETTSWSPQLFTLGDQQRRPTPTPSEPTKPVPRRPQFVLELAGGLALYHSLGGGADASCSTDVVIDGAAHSSCPERNFLSMGFLVSLRAGYRIRPRVSLEVTLGYLRLWHDLTRRLQVTDANGVVYNSVPAPADGSIPFHLDQTRVSMPLVGVGASREFFDRTPLLLRLTTGIGRADVRTAVNGTFVAASGENAAEFPIGVLEDARTLWVPFLAPEVRLGYRFAADWVGDIGIAAWLLWAPSHPRTSSMVSGTPPEQRWVLSSSGGDPVRLGIESALGAALIFVPTLSVRHDF